jgi:hypothetical protein
MLVQNLNEFINVLLTFNEPDVVIQVFLELLIEVDIPKNGIVGIIEVDI